MIQNLFNKTADILRIVNTSDDMGGYTEVETILINNWKCRINWSKGFERVQSDKDTWYRDAKVYGTFTTKIQTKDRFRYSGIDYEIINVFDTDEIHKFTTLEIKKLT